MQPEDLLRVVAVSDPAVAPSGEVVAVVVATVDGEANRARSAIWLVPATGGSPRPLTDGAEADAQPTFSPDGARVAFTRTVRLDDHTETSVLVVPAEGPGDPVVVATTSEQVRSLRWSPDGDRLAWCARTPQIEPDVADRDRPPRHITTLQSRLDDVGWTIDRRQHVHVAPADGSAPARRITSGPFDHEAVDWAPGGAHASSSPPPATRTGTSTRPSTCGWSTPTA